MMAPPPIAKLLSFSPGWQRQSQGPVQDTGPSAQAAAPGQLGHHITNGAPPNTIFANADFVLQSWVVLNKCIDDFH